MKTQNTGKNINNMLSVPLTPKEYADKYGSVCPYCKSKELEGGSYDGDGEYIYMGVTCLDCGKEWDDVYTLTGYSELD